MLSRSNNVDKITCGMCLVTLYLGEKVKLFLEQMTFDEKWSGILHVSEYRKMIMSISE